eukprot:CAMPEP_0113721868 /NCGR_PEP_ID=MMETSP0038_2-20120614/37390_1 /TAXON_ID=2898 /ORGANISM="Cryptomonas paramecium" /LENGTH=311 /DNA_ID=CAMNT_0000650961 /DNA_START=226 /DNA_END=1162 /DNA_ORIENTATION=- /assembly_acc=CAM_ASM_000170
MNSLFGRNIRSGACLLQMYRTTKDYYSILGIKHTADDKEIKKAYKRLAIRTHPDINNQSDAKAAFLLINEAYSVLSDSDQRRRYDRTYRPHQSYQSSRDTGERRSSTAFDFESYWNQFRSKDERPKDIDDSFGKIFSDLLSGVTSFAESSLPFARRPLLLEDLPEFLETILGRGIGDVSYDPKNSTDLRLELEDCEVLVRVLTERADRLRREAACQEVDRRALIQLLTMLSHRTRQLNGRDCPGKFRCPQMRRGRMRAKQGSDTQCKTDSATRRAGGGFGIETTQSDADAAKGNRFSSTTFNTENAIPIGS